MLMVGQGAGRERAKQVRALLGGRKRTVLRIFHRAVNL